MEDRFGRTIEYLRLSVTDRCNLRCRYCMPPGGADFVKHEDMLTYEEILRIIRILAGEGLAKVRLTGGEPTMRKGITGLVKGIHRISGIREIALTTNGLNFADMGSDLARAGVNCVNFSLDALDEDVYESITLSRGAGRVRKAIDQALELGMRVKLNCVPVRGLNEGELTGLADLARTLPLDVRFIELMPIGPGRDYEGIPSGELLDMLRESYGSPSLLGSEPAPGEEAPGPAVYYHFSGFRGTVGFISPMSHRFCSECNRIRLTAQGFLKLCLHRGDGIWLRDALRRGDSDEDILSLIREAVLAKPVEHDFYSSSPEGLMSEIGG